MVSRRKRANSSVGNKLNNLTDRVVEQQKLQQVSGTQTNAVTNDSIAPSAVNTESVQDRSITSSKIGRGEVTSENLGVINEIVASGGLDIEAGVDGHFSLSGGKYEDPYDGIEDGDGYKVVAFDPTNNAIKIIDAAPPAESGLRFDTTYTGGSTAPGMLSWTDEFETLEFMLNDDVTLQVGQEVVYRVKNASGSVAIPDFTVVMFAGATGDTVTVSPATATAIRDNPSYIVGITTQEIPADGFGFVTHFGFVNNVNTSGYTLGNLLYLDPNTTTGQLTATKPDAPFFDTPIAAVTRVQANSGRVLVRMAFGSKMGDLHDVQITSPSEGQTLLYNSSGVWANSALPSHNYLLNGDFSIWQRGTSFSADGYCADRWYFDETGTGGVDIVTTSLPAGFQYGLSADTTGKDDTADVYQCLEQTVVIPLRGKTVTFSCYMKMDSVMRGNPGDFTLKAFYSNASDARTSQTTAIGSQTLTKSDYADWAIARYTFTVPSDAVGLKVGFYPPASDAVNDTTQIYYVTGAQLEVGSMVTPFRRQCVNYQAELAACRRYYIRFTAPQVYSVFGIGGVANSGTNAFFSIPLGVQMRSIPTSVDRSTIRVHDSVSAFAVTAATLSATNSSTDYAAVDFTVASGLTTYRPYFVSANNSTSAYLGFSAEL